MWSKTILIEDIFINTNDNENMLIGFLVIYFIIAFFSIAIIKIFFEEHNTEDASCSSEMDSIYATIWGMLWPITIIGLIILFLYNIVEKIVRKIFYYFRNKKKNI